MVRIALLACLVVACAGPSTHGAAPSPRPIAVPLPAVASVPPRAEPPEAWIESMRAGDFREAARRIDLLPKDRARTPGLRFVRARAARGLGDFSLALALLQNLERDLPVLSTEVLRDRAECALEVGPFGEAARYFSSRGDADSAVKAARAFARAHAPVEARAALDRALRVLGSDDDPRALATRTEARALRAKVEVELGDAGSAATDLRWLAIEAPASDQGRAARAELGALKPPLHLRADQDLIRARKLAESGQLDLAIAAIEDAEHESPRPSPAALLRARGFAYYASRVDYARASLLLAQSSSMDPAEAARDAFFSARALSRAQDDATAIVRYEALAQRFPTTPFAEEAAYQAARLRFLLGQWEAATRAYRKYLDAHAKRNPGRFTRAARYELALALLASGHGGDSLPLLQGLAVTADDPLERATLHELEGAALVDAGEHDRALAAFTAVIRERPLSFPALLAAARIAVLGGKPPAVIESSDLAGAAGPLAVVLPEKTSMFLELGLTADAERDLALHQSELMARYAPRGYEAVCEAFGVVGSGAERYRVGRTAVKAEALDHAPDDATRWAWNCVYPTPFAELVRAAETSRELPYGLIHAVMRQESAFRVDAVSPAGAVGLLQLVPTTAVRAAREIGVDAQPELLGTPAYSVRVGAYYLKKVLGTFGGQIVLAAAAYNAGPEAVSRWLETGEELPLDVWAARIPYAETRGYVSRVVGNLARYDYLQGGEAAVPKLSLVLPKGVRAGPADY